MRISTAQIHASGLQRVLDAQSSLTRSQEEVASGKRVLTPADDPPAAALALRIEQELALNEQYQRNIDVAERDLRHQEVQLQQVEEVLFRMREIVIQAGDGALSNVEREALIVEAEQRIFELLGIFNSKLASGEYLFSGFQGHTQPFVQRSTGVVEYQGDEGRRLLQVSAGIDVEVRDNGKKLFVDIASANNNFVTSVDPANTGSGDIGVGRIVDQAAWDAVFPDDLVITFDNPPSTYSINQRDHVTGALTPVVAAQPYTSGSTITINGAELRIFGTPDAGDEFVLEASNRQALNATLQRFVAGLRASPDTTAGNTERARVIAETLNNLDNAESAIFGARAEIGARLNVLDSTREEQAQSEIINREVLSDIVDVDFNEAISNLSFQSFLLEAAQQSFARIANLSLFNFLR